MESTTLTLAQALVENILEIPTAECTYAAAVDLLRALASTDAEPENGSGMDADCVRDAAAFYMEDPQGHEKAAIDEALSNLPKVGHGEERGAWKACLKEVNAYWKDPAPGTETVEVDHWVTVAESHRTEKPGPLESKALEMCGPLAPRIGTLVNGWNGVYPAPQVTADSPTSTKCIEVDNRAVVWPTTKAVPTLRQEMEAFKRASYLYAAHNGHVRGAKTVVHLRGTARALGCKGLLSRMPLLGLVRLVSNEVGLEWDITTDETEEPPLPNGYTWEKMAEHADKERENAKTAAWERYWDLRMTQCNCYVWYAVEEGNSVGKDAAAQKEVAEQADVQAQRDRIDQTSQIDIDAEVQAPAPNLPVAMEGTVEEIAEKLTAAALGIGVHGAAAYEVEGVMLFRVPRDAVLWFYCAEKDLRFSHRSYLTIRKWVKGIGTKLGWQVTVRRAV